MNNWRCELSSLSAHALLFAAPLWALPPWQACPKDNLNLLFPLFLTEYGEIPTSTFLLLSCDFMSKCPWATTLTWQVQSEVGKKTLSTASKS